MNKFYKSFHYLDGYKIGTSNYYIPGNEQYLKREIQEGSRIISKYAFFAKN